MSKLFSVILAKAGIQLKTRAGCLIAVILKFLSGTVYWIPAFAGMTGMRRLRKILVLILVFQFLTIPLYPVLTVSTVYAQPERDQWYEPAQEPEPYYDPAPFQETPEGEVIPLDDPEPYYPPPPPERRYVSPVYQAPNEEENELPGEEPAYEEPVYDNIPPAAIEEGWWEEPAAEQEAEAPVERSAYEACNDENPGNQGYCDGIFFGIAQPGDGGSAPESAQEEQGSTDSGNWWDTVTEWPEDAWEWAKDTAEETGQTIAEVVEGAGETIAEMFGGGDEETAGNSEIPPVGPQPQDPEWAGKIEAAQAEWDNYKSQALAEDPEAAAQTRARLIASLGLDAGVSDQEILGAVNTNLSPEGLAIFGPTLAEAGLGADCALDPECVPDFTGVVPPLVAAGADTSAQLAAIDEQLRAQAEADKIKSSETVASVLGIGAEFLACQSSVVELFNQARCAEVNELVGNLAIKAGSSIASSVTSSNSFEGSEEHNSECTEIAVRGGAAASAEMERVGCVLDTRTTDEREQALRATINPDSTSIPNIEEGLRQAGLPLTDSDGSATSRAQKIKDIASQVKFDMSNPNADSGARENFIERVIASDPDAATFIAEFVGIPVGAIQNEAIARGVCEKLEGQGVCALGVHGAFRRSELDTRAPSTYAALTQDEIDKINANAQARFPDFQPADGNAVVDYAAARAAAYSGFSDEGQPAADRQMAENARRRATAAALGLDVNSAEFKQLEETYRVWNVTADETLANSSAGKIYGEAQREKEVQVVVGALGAGLDGPDFLRVGVAGFMIAKKALPSLVGKKIGNEVVTSADHAANIIIRNGGQIADVEDLTKLPEAQLAQAPEADVPAAVSRTPAEENIPVVEAPEVAPVTPVVTNPVTEVNPEAEYDWYDPRRWIGMKPQEEVPVARVDEPEQVAQGTVSDPIRVEEPEVEAPVSRAQEPVREVEVPAPNRVVDPNPQADVEVPRVDEQAVVPAPKVDDIPVEPDAPTQIADAPTPIRPEEPNPVNVDLPCAAALPSGFQFVKQVYAQNRTPCTPEQIAEFQLRDQQAREEVVQTRAALDEIFYSEIEPINQEAAAISARIRSYENQQVRKELRPRGEVRMDPEYVRLSQERNQAAMRAVQAREERINPLRDEYLKQKQVAAEVRDELDAGLASRGEPPVGYADPEVKAKSEQFFAEDGLSDDDIVFRSIDRSALTEDGYVKAPVDPVAEIRDDYRGGEIIESWELEGPGLNVSKTRRQGSYGADEPGKVMVGIRVGDLKAAGAKVYSDVTSITGSDALMIEIPGTKIRAARVYDDPVKSAYYDGIDWVKAQVDALSERLGFKAKPQVPDISEVPAGQVDELVVGTLDEVNLSEVEKQYLGALRKEQEALRVHNQTFHGRGQIPEGVNEADYVARIAEATKVKEELAQGLTPDQIEKVGEIAKRDSVPVSNPVAENPVVEAITEVVSPLKSYVQNLLKNAKEVTPGPSYTGTQNRLDEFGQVTQNVPGVFDPVKPSQIDAQRSKVEQRVGPEVSDYPVVVTRPGDDIFDIDEIAYQVSSRPQNQGPEFNGLAKLINEYREEPSEAVAILIRREAQSRGIVLEGKLPGFAGVIEGVSIKFYAVKDENVIEMANIYAVKEEINRVFTSTEEARDFLQSLGDKVVLHEFGHVAYDKLTLVQKVEWKAIVDKNPSLREQIIKIHRDKHATVEEIPVEEEAFGDYFVDALGEGSLKSRLVENPEAVDTVNRFIDELPKPGRGAEGGLPPCPLSLIPSGFSFIKVVHAVAPCPTRYQVEQADKAFDELLEQGAANKGRGYNNGLGVTFDQFKTVDNGQGQQTFTLDIFDDPGYSLKPSRRSPDIFKLTPANVDALPEGQHYNYIVTSDREIIMAPRNKDINERELGEKHKQLAGEAWQVQEDATALRPNTGIVLAGEARVLDGQLVVDLRSGTIFQKSLGRVGQDIWDSTDENLGRLEDMVEGIIGKRPLAVSRANPTNPNRLAQFEVDKQAALARANQSADNAERAVAADPRMAQPLSPALKTRSQLKAEAEARIAEVEAVLVEKQAALKKAKEERAAQEIIVKQKAGALEAADRELAAAQKTYDDESSGKAKPPKPEGLPDGWGKNRPTYEAARQRVIDTIPRREGVDLSTLGTKQDFSSAGGGYSGADIYLDSDGKITKLLPIGKDDYDLLSEAAALKLGNRGEVTPVVYEIVKTREGRVGLRMEYLSGPPFIEIVQNGPRVRLEAIEVVAKYQDVVGRAHGDLGTNIGQHIRTAGSQNKSGERLRLFDPINVSADQNITSKYEGINTVSDLFGDAKLASRNYQPPKNFRSLSPTDVEKAFGAKLVDGLYNDMSFSEAIEAAKFNPDGSLTAEFRVLNAEAGGRLPAVKPAVVVSISPQTEAGLASAKAKKAAAQGAYDQEVRNAQGKAWETSYADQDVRLAQAELEGSTRRLEDIQNSGTWLQRAADKVEDFPLIGLVVRKLANRLDNLGVSSASAGPRISSPNILQRGWDKFTGRLGDEMVWIRENPAQTVVRVSTALSAASGLGLGVFVMLNPRTSPIITPDQAKQQNAPGAATQTSPTDAVNDSAAAGAPPLGQPPVVPEEEAVNSVPRVISVGPAEETEAAVKQLPGVTDEVVIEGAKAAVESRDIEVKSVGAGCGSDNRTIWVREYVDGFKETVEDYGKIPGQCGVPLPGGTCTPEVSKPYGQCAGTAGLQDKSVGIEYEVTRTIACNDGKSSVTYASKEVGPKGYCPRPPVGEQGKPELKKASESCSYNFECSTGLKCDSESKKCVASHVNQRIAKEKDLEQFNFCGNLGVKKKSDGAVFNCYDKGPYKNRKVQIIGDITELKANYCVLQIFDLGPGENCAKP